MNASTSSSAMNVNDASEQDAEEHKLSFLSAVELQVFKNFVDNYRVKRELLREDAIALDYVFGPAILQAFEMIEEQQVSIKQGPTSQRVLVEVVSNTGTSYWVPPGHSVCQCMAYTHSKKVYCKHILAAHLMISITPKEEYQNISENELDELYNGYFSPD